MRGGCVAISDQTVHTPLEVSTPKTTIVPMTRDHVGHKFLFYHSKKATSSVMK